MNGKKICNWTDELDGGGIAARVIENIFHRFEIVNF
jgi:hypothetical protein